MCGVCLIHGVRETHIQILVLDFYLCHLGQVSLKPSIADLEMR